MGCDKGLAGAGGLIFSVCESCTNLYMAGRVLAGIWRKKRKWRKSRVKAGEFFFLVLVVVTLLHQFFACQESVPGFGNPSTSLKFDRHTQVSRRLGEQSVESGGFRSG